MKRTDNKTLSDISDAPDLQRLVQDKRSQKRATNAKASRRNRRFDTPRPEGTGILKNTKP